MIHSTINYVNNTNTTYTVDNIGSSLHYTISNWTLWVCRLCKRNRPPLLWNDPHFRLLVAFRNVRSRHVSIKVLLSCCQRRHHTKSIRFRCPLTFASSSATRLTICGSGVS